jgi:hypothetical protein
MDLADRKGKYMQQKILQSKLSDVFTCIQVTNSYLSLNNQQT